MTYFSGFCLKGEEELFADRIQKPGLYDVCGFSYGAILAFEEAWRRILEGRRVGRLILLSPAFFQNKSNRYLQFQIEAFKKDPQSYAGNLLRIGGFESHWTQKYFRQGSLNELEELTGYLWESERLEKTSRLCAGIETHLGGKDKITDWKRARDFFAPHASVFLIKQANHFLKIRS